MLFNYDAIDQQGTESKGSIDAISLDVAISSLQRRGLVIKKIDSAEKKSIWTGDIEIFSHVSNKEVVVLSRQLATLFEAQVPALRVFRLIASEAENKTLGKALTEIADDLQGGSSISKALAKHPKIFSEFYTNMVRSGEESGKLDEVFIFLADHLDRSYEVNSKARNALIYPAFVIFTFMVVMALMLTVVIPKISSILTDSGQPIPLYTQIVIGMSHILVTYGIFLVVALVIGGFFLVRFLRTPAGKLSLDDAKIKTPFVKNLYQKLYLSRISDNMNTMLVSGIPMVRALELTADVVDNEVYKKALLDATEEVKGGKSVSDALTNVKIMPGIMIQMIKVGEESGELGKILKTLSIFYSREVVNAVDTLVDLIEPAMIVLLGLGVGFLLASVLIPIYNISSNIS
ncbi:MAG: type II secretion system F family protein [Patescibacteria group bacterium]|nr:type II secretion system F family protein [Patescibacteria group bacterium]MDE2116358.1 type II secretion system F family protein [Patescibacteria group bacterium]